MYIVGFWERAMGRCVKYFLGLPAVTLFFNVALAGVNCSLSGSVYLCTDAITQEQTQCPIMTGKIIECVTNASQALPIVCVDVRPRSKEIPSVHRYLCSSHDLFSKGEDDKHMCCFGFGSKSVGCYAVAKDNPYCR